MVSDGTGTDDDVQLGEGRTDVHPIEYKSDQSQECKLPCWCMTVIRVKLPALQSLPPEDSRNVGA